ncbi:MAG TPA: response regulator [Rugosimonospora sp.]|jgi:CheY-like chemotaxis protein|nr:response regulator [Rugosimonospora sp.]
MVNENASSATDVLALVDDLFFQAKLAETARKLGVMLKTVSTGAALVKELEGPPAGARSDLPRLVVVDLNARQGALEAIEQLQRSGNLIPIIGFLSHVQTELAQRARAAGCKQVMPRSSFTMNLSDILRQAKS